MIWRRSGLASTFAHEIERLSWPFGKIRTGSRLESKNYPSKSAQTERAFAEQPHTVSSKPALEWHPNARRCSSARCRGDAQAREEPSLPFEKFVLIPSMPEPRSKSISLLLVDDSITLRQWWKAILSGIPGVLVVAEAASAAQALELFDTVIIKHPGYMA